MTITHGQFTVEDGHEVYCTLCGDGGHLVLCDFCDKSFCQSCIARISGKGHLENLLSSEDAEFQCYLCDPLPLERQKKCLNILQSVLSSRNSLEQGPKKKFKSAEFVSDSDKDSESHSISTAGTTETTAVSTAAPTGTTEPTSRSSDNSILHSTTHQEQDTQPSQEVFKNRSASKKPLRLSTSKKTESRVFPTLEASSEENSDSSPGSSLSDEDSPEVNTDDVSISEGSLLSGETNKRKRMKKRRKRDRENREELEREATLHLVGGMLEVNSDLSSVEDLEWKPIESTAVATTSDDKHRKKYYLKAKKNLVATQPCLEGSDFECDSESSTNKTASIHIKRARKRRLSSASSHTSTNGSSNLQRASKRSRFAQALSSGSDSEGDSVHHRLAVGMLDNPVEHCLTPTPPDADLTLTPVTYLTPRSKLRLRSPDSSDSDVVFSGRKPKRKPQTKNITSTSTSRSNSRSSEEIGKNEKRTKRRGPHPLRLAGSSDDDFADLSRIGPRLKKKTVKRTIFTDSDSVSGNETETEKNAAMSEREDVHSDLDRSAGKNSTPGKKRKAIRKLISDAKLDEKTKLAQKREKERLDRLKKKTTSTSGTQEDQVLILEEDSETKEPKVSVSYLSLSCLSVNVVSVYVSGERFCQNEQDNHSFLFNVFG